MTKKYTSKDEILKKAKEAIGSKIGKFDINQRLLQANNKGRLGQVIEEGLFGYEINSNPIADFSEAGVELKVTPYKKLKKKNNKGKDEYSAKERLVLNIIDYENEHKVEFYASGFWKKNQSLLLMLYLFDEVLDVSDYLISHVLLYEYPEEDLRIIKNDWEFIKKMIKDGRAHQLSESQTTYLGACTKGANKSSLKSQPFSDIHAMQRAYCFKQSYMTSLLRNKVFKNDTANNKLIYDVSQLSYLSFEEIVIGKINDYVGYTQNSLIKLFNLDSLKRSKNINEFIIARIFNAQGRLSETDQFKKANIVPKTIQIKESGSIPESMSFMNFKFNEVINTDWDDSVLKEYFLTTKFLFIVFRKSGNEKILVKSIFWSMPVEDIETDLKKMYLNLQKTLREGVVIREVGKQKINNLPKLSANRVAHVRPKAAASSYERSTNSDELPDGRWMTKQCYWLNSSYIKSIIE